MKEKLKSLKSEVLKELSEVKDEISFNLIKSKYLGKKSEFTEIMKTMSELKDEEKKEIGLVVTEFRNTVNEAFDTKLIELKEKELNSKLESGRIDITLPSKKVKKGSLHPVTRVVEEIQDLFVSMGYEVVDGPEIESDLFNFELLNLPKGHPARDAQDSFYITEELLLRTHTSPMQARVMQKCEGKKPIKIICTGKTYRRDDDASHSHQFGQVEGLVVDKNITLSDLKGTLEELCKKLLGEKTEVRFRASYFPFTEPSYEVDATCFKCGGNGCPLCKHTGWIEIGGSGMVHPNVLRMNGYNPDEWTGFAFGSGLDRIAMIKYNIPDIRYLYTNDIRMLNQFTRKEDKNETK